jgi:DME family drug/metabolite transporter
MSVSSVSSESAASAAPSALATPRSGGGLRFLILSGLLWGTGGLTGRLLARGSGLAPAAVAGYRLAIGGVLLVALLAVTGRAVPRGRAAWTRIVVVGLLAACFQACYFGAVALTSVSLATLVAIGAAPVVVLGFERATGRRRLDASAVGTVGLALVGLALLVGRPTSGVGTGALLGGLGLALGAATGFAAISLVCTTPVSGLDDLALTGYGFTLGGLGVLLPTAAATTGVGFAPRAGSLALLLLLGFAPTALAYTLYFRGLRSVAASTATVTALLEPLTGAVLAAVLLGDRIGLVGGVGAGLLAVSVLLSARSSVRAVG